MCFGAAVALWCGSATILISSLALATSLRLFVSGDPDTLRIGRLYQRTWQKSVADTGGLQALQCVELQLLGLHRWNDSGEYSSKVHPSMPQVPVSPIVTSGEYPSATVQQPLYFCEPG